jgi:hypothetical protein
VHRENSWENVAAILELICFRILDKIFTSARTNNRPDSAVSFIGAKVFAVYRVATENT